MNSFYLQLFVSFLAGGLFIAFQTLIAERAPLAWRGLILTIPSTMALGLFFVGFSKTPQDAAEAAQVVPAALAGSYIFSAAFARFIRWGFPAGFFGSLILLASWGVVLYLFPPSSFLNATFFYGIPLILLSYFAVQVLPQVTHLSPFPINTKHILVRSFVGGIVIGCTAFFAKTLGNFWGGMFSTFPAAFFSAFVIYYHFHGKEVIPSVAKSLFFPGSVGFIIYAFVVAMTFSQYGIWLGTLFSYLAVFFFFLAVEFFRKFVNLNWQPR